ncbi:MAG: hypothetical protein SP1CHLAM54_16840 [Chlamydiia bacterium]|nr:hypothetical protein [Chlamydiia bacterium]MCH9616573.1 hypothetical protein [Chlamydiia bacterium]MCH9629303.1 hypothetical protein [Chlamydiia bacterium]
MNYTREPIIETILTPKEGHKLIVRSSSGAHQEEYNVDAVEIVSFGDAFFFRSQERPKSFLVPVSDYEVIEGKETRSVLKKASVEKNIKIAGGRREKEPPPPEPFEEQKPKKRRTRRRRVAKEEPTDDKNAENPVSEEDAPLVKKLLPPPATLISEHLAKYKSYQITEPGLFEEPQVEDEVLPETVEDSTLEEYHPEVTTDDVVEPELVKSEEELHPVPPDSEET